MNECDVALLLCHKRKRDAWNTDESETWADPSKPKKPAYANVISKISNTPVIQQRQLLSKYDIAFKNYQPSMPTIVEDEEETDAPTMYDDEPIRLIVHSTQ
ncbi:Hypothetical protein CINCED_3A019131 [Cinara cedri]|uniref:Uncharacterized protein n=1 Tax=Cinara cedri TaxID=506608 RepID=A0A5E4MMA4_9HEMI|nr:Hypothetical protein CINCED_3A019131 [Cinara cedri]